METKEMAQLIATRLVLREALMELSTEGVQRVLDIGNDLMTYWSEKEELSDFETELRNESRRICFRLQRRIDEGNDALPEPKDDAEWEKFYQFYCVECKVAVPISSPALDIQCPNCRSAEFLEMMLKPSQTN